MELTGLLLALGTAVAVMLMTHRISKTKTVSESMLRTYEKMLAEVRHQRNKAATPGVDGSSTTANPAPTHSDLNAGADLQ